MNYSYFIMKKLISIICLAISTIAYAQDLKDVSYTSNTDEYAQERCKLDVYNINKSKKLKPAFVWFHGGGITGGDKKFSPQKLPSQKNGFVLICANYRLSPKIKAWEAIDDTAEAVAWVFKNAEKLGVDKTKIFIGGHSAGGYLSGMVGFAPKYLQKHNIKNTDLAGIILLSAQVTKHFRVRKDCGDTTNSYVPQIDELSILGNVQNKIAPLCIVLGDRRLEWKCRVEENFFLEATVRTLNTSPYTEIFELQGTHHGSCADGLTVIATSFIKKVCKMTQQETKK